MYARWEQDGFRAPRIAGRSTPEKVARVVISCIEKDRAEVVLGLVHPERTGRRWRRAFGRCSSERARSGGGDPAGDEELVRVELAVAAVHVGLGIDLIEDGQGIAI
jgi:hypothetical protein